MPCNFPLLAETCLAADSPAAHNEANEWMTTNCTLIGSDTRFKTRQTHRSTSRNSKRAKKPNSTEGFLVQMIYNSRVANKPGQKAALQLVL